MKGKSVLLLSGTSLAATYTASDDLQIGRAQELRFWQKSIRSAGSAATTTTIKLQFRYNDGTTQTGYLDLPSQLDDVVGAAQPKGSTLEIEHAYSTPANATNYGTFRLDNPKCIDEITVSLKVNAAGQAGDSTEVFLTNFLNTGRS